MNTHDIHPSHACNRRPDRAAVARLTLAGALMLLFALVLASPAAALQQTLTATDGDAGDQLGTSVAVDGDTLVLGAPSDDASRGAVYVYRRSGDSWTQAAKLTASDGAAGDLFGGAVAIDGDTIVAGALGDDVGANTNQGSVYTFARAGAKAARTETAKLTASDGALNDELGISVAVDGDTIVAGAFADDIGANVDQGSVYTFTRKGATARTQTAKLTASDGAAGDEVGHRVAIAGDTIVAGAPSDDVGAIAEQGSAYTFTRAGAAERTETAKLTAGDGAATDAFGVSVAIDDDTIVVGAFGHGVGANAAQGAVYTFTRAGAAARTETAELTAGDGAAGDLLGASVAVDGDTIVAGALLDDIGDTADQGSVYTFTRAGPAARTETAKLTAGDGAERDLLGVSLAVDGDTIVAGAFLDDVDDSADQGSASVFFAATPLPAVATAAPPPPPPPTSNAKPVLSKLKVSPSRFRGGSSLSKVAGSHAVAKITFTLSEPATVKLSFAKAEPGRTVGHACRKPNRSNHAKRPCTRYVSVGSFTVQGRSGANTVAFAGRLPAGKRLAPGSYTLAATPTDGAQNTGQTRTAKLRITTPKRVTNARPR